jgi:hypothetical protein
LDDFLNADPSALQT